MMETRRNLLFNRAKPCTNRMVDFLSPGYSDIFAQKYRQKPLNVRAHSIYAHPKKYGTMFFCSLKPTVEHVLSTKFSTKFILKSQTSRNMEICFARLRAAACRHAGSDPPRARTSL